MKRLCQAALVAMIVCARPETAGAGWLDYVRWFDGLSGPQYQGIVVNPELFCGFKDQATQEWQTEASKYFLYCDDDPTLKRSLKWGVGLRLQALRGHSLGSDFQFPPSREASSLGVVGIGARGFYRLKNWAEVDLATTVHDFRPGPTVTSVDLGVAVRVIPFAGSSSSRRGVWLGLQGSQLFGEIRPEDFGAAPGPADSRERTASVVVSFRIF